MVERAGERWVTGERERDWLEVEGETRGEMVDCAESPKGAG